MLGNILLTMIRNMKRNLLFTMINIVGLSIGIAATLLIVLWIRDEWAVDRFHENGDRVYRVIEIQNVKGRNPTHVPYRPMPLGPALEMEFPSVEKAVRIMPIGKMVLGMEGRNVEVDRNLIVEDGFFDLMTFPVNGESADTVLEKPFQAVLSHDTAVRLFGNEDPLGKRLTFQGHELVVAAVMGRDARPNHLEPDMLISFPTMVAGDFLSEDALQLWGNNNIYTYILLRPGADPKALESQLHDFMARHREGEYNNVSYLQNIHDIYLHSQQVGYAGPWKKENLRYLYMFGAIALFLILIACFNFMNLATAQATGRAREVGVRKTIGATRGQLMAQFFSETLLLTALAFLIALALTELVLPYFNQLCGKSLELRILLNSGLILALPVLLLFVGLVSGSYPAVFLSRFRPARVLRGGSGNGLGSLNHLRRALVIVQFAVTVFLIGATGVVFYQLHYAQSRDLGYRKDNVVVVQLERDHHNQADRLRQRISTMPGVESVSVGSQIPGRGANGEWSMAPTGYEGDESWVVPLIKTDGAYLDVFGIQLLKGRTYSIGASGEAPNQVMVNETLARQFGWEEPLGKTMRIPGWSEETLEVVGLVKDYHIKSLHDMLEPLVLVPSREESYVSLRLDGSVHAGEIMGRLEKVWDTFAPGRAFRAYYLDEVTGALYRNDERAGSIVGHGAGLAILVACLGLFGLAVYDTKQRTKEIGIRKVMGASVARIVGWLSLRFTRWLIVANILAIPACAWIMNRWLGQFAYRVDTVLPVYIGTVVLSILVGLLTVCGQAWRAARANPVDALKYE